MYYAFEYSGSKWNLEVLVFEERGKLEYLGEKLLEQRKNQKQTYGPCSELNPADIGGRRVLSPLCQPCSPNVCIMYVYFIITNQEMVHSTRCCLRVEQIQVSFHYSSRKVLHLHKG